jgi:hypothetical protein
LTENPRLAEENQSKTTGQFPSGVEFPFNLRGTGTWRRYDAGAAVGVGRTARISAVGVWHWEASPVCRISGVE